MYFFRKCTHMSPKCTQRDQEWIPKAWINFANIVPTQAMSFKFQIPALFKKNSLQNLQLTKFYLLTITFRKNMPSVITPGNSSRLHLEGAW